MKYLIISFLTLCSNVYAQDQISLVQSAIIHLQPKLDMKQSYLIAKAVSKYSQIYDLDWKIVTAILSQESSFKTDPNNCAIKKNYLKNIHCKDLGIGQINHHTWLKALNLDTHRALIDVDYNIQNVAIILSMIKKDYGREKTWHTRYHSFTHSHRKIYADFIYHKFLKLDSFVKGYMARELKIALGSNLLAINQ